MSPSLSRADVSGVRSLLKQHLRHKLAGYAQQRLASASVRPKIVAVTGSVGKSSTKEAIVAGLTGSLKVLTSAGNYNTAFGVPLTILGLKGGSGSYRVWQQELAEAKRIAQESWKDAPDVIVLEYGVDRPGDMDQLLEIATPDIAVITPIPDVPVHGAFFPSPQAIAEEKGKLIAGRTDGAVFLAGDSRLTRALASRTGMRVMTYGWGEKNDVRVDHPTLLVGDHGPSGLTGKVFLQGATLPLRLDHAIAPVHFLAAAAALAVAKELGVNAVEVLGRLTTWKPPSRRMERKQMPDGTTIIDDTYNASPEAMQAALELLKEFPVLGRKIAVLGDMRELHASQDRMAHEAAGKAAAKATTLLIAVGERKNWMAEACRAAGGTAQEAADKDEVARLLCELDLKKEDVVLFKASRAIELEKVVDALIGKDQ